ncbi:hypothetical protein [Streptomyces sp. NPDC046821]|uniref:hypothetical protein n=1 Tax=Streptomyces sp. NPDC046821 TaxID=3154702 RepID=UPI0033F65BDC
MPTIALLIFLLLVLVGLLVIGALGYAAYRRPALTQPLMDGARASQESQSA